MPWCEPCSRYLTPSSMTDDGRCPHCGADIDEAQRHTDQALDNERTPWHFKLLVTALIAYLAWRVIDLFM